MFSQISQDCSTCLPSWLGLVPTPASDSPWPVFYSQGGHPVLLLRGCVWISSHRSWRVVSFHLLVSYSRLNKLLHSLFLCLIMFFLLPCTSSTSPSSCQICLCKRGCFRSSSDSSIQWSIFGPRMADKVLLPSAGGQDRCSFCLQVETCLLI